MDIAVDDGYVLNQFEGSFVVVVAAVQEDKWLAVVNLRVRCNRPVLLIYVACNLKGNEIPVVVTCLNQGKRLLMYSLAVALQNLDGKH